MELGILSILRDEEHNLASFFKFLESIESSFVFDSIVYSFYENDSSDKTRDVLSGWLKTRHAYLSVDDFNESPFASFSQDKLRTQRLARCRNIALEPLLNSTLPWLLIVDADISLSLNNVLELFRWKFKYRFSSMMCASSVQNVPDIFGHFPYSYYDSWALRDLYGYGGISFAENPFTHPLDRWRWQARLPVSVSSAFGGLALVDLGIVRKFNQYWNGDCGCEHWSFCESARQFAPVYACPTVMPRVVHPSPIPTWCQDYPQSIYNLLSIRHQEFCASLNISSHCLGVFS
ncbi:hypothetical protein [Synechococcus sp. PROS-U-1]|uniref:hypothetical protein n=1 Tax=Synechococcus sp. PROS-U-1 TaxID=1400866 RepID=UPI001646817C|nr:hypothetical protein [Synechococcus sp. PROS-U-1]QNJ01762.1 nucleotide-diphospho-sugar transferase [Synechococcus sp. PROS-U-1]